MSNTNTKLNVAHRGSSDNCPENTISAFNKAWLDGADICEGDFRITKDGVMVCMHDEDTLRVSGEKMIISETSYADLCKLNVGWHFGEEWNEAIPTLVEVLDTVPENSCFLIEIKSGVESVRALLDTLKSVEPVKFKFGVISFDKEVLRAVKKSDNQIITLLLNDVKDKVVNSELKDILVDIGANGLLTNSINDELKVQIESLKMIYNIWKSKPNFKTII